MPLRALIVDDEDLARQARITRLPDDHTDISREKKA